MECTEVKVHTQNIKPRAYCVCVCVCSKQGGGSAFVSQGFGISGSSLLTSVLVFSLVLESEGKCCGMLI